MNYNGIDPEENLPEDIANTDEYKKPAADLPEEKAVTHHKKRFNFKIFLRSFFLTLLVAGLMLVAWRGGIFAVDYFAARRDGMSPKEAAADRRTVFRRSQRRRSRSPTTWYLHLRRRSRTITGDVYLRRATASRSTALTTAIPMR